MQNPYNLSTRLNETFVTASSFNFFEILPPIHHAAALAPATYLFTAIAFPCKRVLYAKFRLQGVAQIFGAEPFSAEKVVAAPWLPDCSRDCERSCEPRARPLCRRPAGAKLCPETNTATHPSGKESQTPQRNLSVHSETFMGCNYIPVVLGLTSSAVCFLKGSDGLWYGAHLVPGFWLWTVSIQDSPQSTSDPNPLTQNATQAAQKKDNVLISISQKQTLFSGKATLQESVVFLALFSTHCSNSSAWDGAVRDTSGTPKYRNFLLQSVLWHRDRPHAGFLIPTQGIKKHNQRLNFRRGVFTFENFHIQKGKPFNTSEIW